MHTINFFDHLLFLFKNEKGQTADEFVNFVKNYLKKNPIIATSIVKSGIGLVMSDHTVMAISAEEEEKIKDTSVSISQSFPGSTYTVPTFSIGI